MASLGPNMARPALWRQARALRPSGMGADQFADMLTLRLGLEQPPIDVVRVCEYLGIQLFNADSPRWSGAVNSDEYSATIWVRADDALIRQRFTIAHELGHLMLHSLGVSFRDDTFTGTSAEMEANRFAAAFLMPERLVRAAAEHTQLSEHLAAQFRVSEQAMKIRLSTLGMVSHATEQNAEFWRWQDTVWKRTT